MPVLRTLSIAIALLCFVTAVFGQAKYEPRIGQASEDGQRQISGFKIDKAFERRLFAAEPMVANPVCFWVDSRGRVFVGETYRQEQGGVPDNRSFSFWRDDDLKNQTLADRRAMYLTHRPHFAIQFTQHHDRIVLLEDTDGDRKADSSKVFADGFNDILDGTGAGLLVRGNDVYYTCIPNLWRLSDTNGDGKCDRRRILHTGYGIRIALRGHDLHGLVMGPDGRLYFSIGDRGYNITTDDGRLLKCPWSGAVFRCEPDGSGLEVFATGLRNPQELAFDDLGNLFTGDNNSDSADRARILYVVEGGETGWRMNFQYRPDRGGWVSEGWWKTRHEKQAAFLIPPLAHLGSGPSGFTHYPGTGLPAAYANTFFMCDFRGGRGNSGVRAFRLEPEGAGFKLAWDEKFLWGCLATDMDFGPDGTIWVSDWVHGWVGEGKGRIYTFQHRDDASRSAGAQTAKILGEGFGGRPEPELQGLLHHADRRVRLEAQYELVTRDSAGARSFLAVARGAGERLGRLHAVWGLGQMARQHSVDEVSGLLPLLQDPDPEVRAQVVRTLGERRVSAAHAGLRKAMKDPAPRVRYFAALNLARYGDAADVSLIVELIRENADEDVFLRHAGVMGLVGVAPEDALAAMSGESSPAVRLAAVLALRRKESPRVAEFLADENALVATAASRAIYDVPIPAAYPALAATLASPRVESVPHMRRAIAAAELLGDSHHVEGLLGLVTRADVPAATRAEALEVLRDWGTDRDFERILNMWRPRPAGASGPVATALGRSLPGVLASAPPRVKQAAAAAAGRHRVVLAGEALLRIVRDGKEQPKTRTLALEALESMESPHVSAAVAAALASDNGTLRGRGARALSRFSPHAAIEVIRSGLQGGGISERQIGIETLARLGRAESDALLVTHMDELLDGTLPNALWLETLEAARGRAKHSVGLKDRIARFDAAVDPKDPMDRFRSSLEGGDAERGRQVFMNKTETSCRRCHQHGKHGATDGDQLAGPELTHIGSGRGRDYLLRAIANPNLDTAEGFASWLVETKGMDVYRGRITLENEQEFVIEVKDPGEPLEKVTVKKSEVVYRGREKSSMPEDLIQKLTARELRDLVAFLASSK